MKARADSEGVGQRKRQPSLGDLITACRGDVLDVTGAQRAQAKAVTLEHLIVELVAHAAQARGGGADPAQPAHSHSMVPGGLEVMSRVTRLTSATSLVIRVEMRSMTS